jgi:hypothetical protein
MDLDLATEIGNMLLSENIGHRPWPPVDITMEGTAQRELMALTVVDGQQDTLSVGIWIDEVSIMQIGCGDLDLPSTHQGEEFLFTLGAAGQVMPDLPERLTRPFKTLGLGQMSGLAAEIKDAIIRVQVHAFNLLLGMGIANISMRGLYDVDGKWLNH